MPAISVIMPVYNAAKHLEKSIKSILNQTFTDFEFIIINDGSTDGSLEVILQFDDNRIKVFSFANNRGIVAALNFGIEKSQAPFIARMDADDWSYENRLEKQYMYLCNHPEVDVLSCLVQHGGDAKAQAGYRHYIAWINQLISHNDIFLNRFEESPIAHPSVMMRKSVLDTYGNYQKGGFPEDYALWLHLMDKGCRFEKMSELLLVWNDPVNRLSRTHFSYSEHAFFQLKIVHLKKEIKRLMKRAIYVWGYGKKVFKKVAILEQNQLHIEGFIDIKEQGLRKRKVVHYEQIEYAKIIVLVLVKDRKGKSAIKEFLKKKQLIQNQDYFIL